MDCVFCKIRDGQIPSFKIHEDERTLTFMDINPLNSGHCLVATKAHAATIHEADVDDLKAVMVAAKKVAAVIQQALKPDGLFIGGQWSEPRLIGLAYDYEQATHVRVPPQFIPTIGNALFPGVPNP